MSTADRNDDINDYSLEKDEYDDYDDEPLDRTKMNDSDLDVHKISKKDDLRQIIFNPKKRRERRKKHRGKFDDFLLRCR